jgi:TRAP-type mannitol/chloroaromatic compound transport system permease small subunit
MADVEVDSLFGRSAKAVREAWITRTGCIYFLIQACRLVYYSLMCT